MAKQSAGLVMYRMQKEQVEVFLVHPGGPFWARKDLEAWSVPKGEYEESESALEAAKREFREETGFTPTGPFESLGSVKQAGGKIMAAWGFEGDCNPADLVSNTYEIERPPRSGRRIKIPEVDRGCWFALEEARRYIRKSHEALLDRLMTFIRTRSTEA